MFDFNILLYVFNLILIISHASVYVGVVLLIWLPILFDNSRGQMLFSGEFYIIVDYVIVNIGVRIWLPQRLTFV